MYLLFNNLYRKYLLSSPPTDSYGFVIIKGWTPVMDQSSCSTVCRCWDPDAAWLNLEHLWVSFPTSTHQLRLRIVSLPPLNLSLINFYIQIKIGSNISQNCIHLSKNSFKSIQTLFQNCPSRHNQKLLQYFFKTDLSGSMQNIRPFRDTP